jgi:hypothetical protein
VGFVTQLRFIQAVRKKAEHGGFVHDDTNVTMFFSNPGLRRNIVTSRVETAESRLPSWTPFI